jgi:hypothetical protein
VSPPQLESVTQENEALCRLWCHDAMNGETKEAIVNLREAYNKGFFSFLKSQH